MDQLKLWYKSAAKGWGQGLPLGNGNIGVVVAAAPLKEIWSMTELTYWSGQKEPSGHVFPGAEQLERIREHLFAGEYAEGDQLAKQNLQPAKLNFGTNLSLCDIELQFGGGETTASFEGAPEAADFRRSLSLDEAVVETYCRLDGEELTREVFATHTGNVLASRIRSTKQGGVSFTIGIVGRTRRFNSALTPAGDAISFTGQAVEDIHSNGEGGVSCQGLLKVILKGGSISPAGDRLIITGADEAEIYYAVATDFRQTGDDWRFASARRIGAATVKGYDRLRAEHLADYQPLYRRVTLDLGESAHSGLPTDERIRLFKAGQVADPALFTLFFQYGRYLMIAGSRADSPLPLHLQGIWNDGEANRMAWSCDYHLDINTEMNYFPAEIANLSECQLPLMRYVEDLAAAGREAARDFYGASGWVAHVFSNVWGFAAPGWETSWGLNVTGGLWIATQMIEHYDYTGDRQFLTEQAYPVLKEAAAFFLDYMRVHPRHGWLVSGPSNSPENSFYPGDNREQGYQLSMGSTLDQVLIRDLLEFCLRAARELNTDEALQQVWQVAIAKLPPLQIGKRGQVLEWLEDYAEAQPEHRHMSHLYALYPSNQITPRSTPELSAAARVTLLNRMAQHDLEDVEFTAALFALFFARLHDGDRAYHHLAHLIGELCLDNLLTFSKAGIAGAEANIFVIDGNFGGTAALAELLVQGHAGELHLLPALPLAWQKGSAKGLRAKGNLEVDLAWAEGRLTAATVRAFASGRKVIRFGERTVTLELEAGGVYTLDGRL